MGDETKRVMKNMLVTGGAGFIGTNFIRHVLKSSEIRIVNLDLLTYAGNRQNLEEFEGKQNYLFCHGDICDSELVSDLLEKYTIDTVVHFAAESHVDRSIDGPAVFVKTNTMGTLTLLEICKQVWLEDRLLPKRLARFHHISTDEVYGSLESNENPWTETSPYLPNSPYSASKAACDHLVRAYGHTYGLPYTITNCSNNFGPYQLPEKLIPLMIVNGLRGEKLPIYGDGQQIRDWLHVEDHVIAIFRALESRREFTTYNIGGGNQPTNLDLVRLLCNILDELSPLENRVSRTNLITFVEDRKGHDRRYAIDYSKATRELGWQPENKLEDGLRKTVTWYLDNLDWVKAIETKQEHTKWIRRNYLERRENK